MLRIVNVELVYITFSMGLLCVAQGRLLVPDEDDVIPQQLQRVVFLASCHTITLVSCKSDAMSFSLHTSGHGAISATTDVSPFQCVVIEHLPDAGIFNQTLANLTKQSGWSQFAKFFVVLTSVLPELEPIEQMFRIFKRAKIFDVLIFAESQKGVMLLTYFPMNCNSDDTCALEINNSMLQDDSFDLFPDKCKNMKGQPLTASMVGFPPKSIPIDSMNISAYRESTYEMNMLRTLTRYMNASLVVMSPADKSFLGSRRQDGHITGSSGDVAYGRADIASNGRYYKPSWLDVIQYTYPVDKDDLCMIVPKAGRVPKYLSYLRPFTNSMWAATMASLPIAIVIWRLIMKGSRSVELDVFGSFLSVSLASHPCTCRERIFYLSWLLYGIVVTNAFQGSLTSYLTLPMFLPDIDTMEELYTSGIDPLGFPGFEHYLPFDPEEDDFYSKIYKKIKVIDVTTHWDSPEGAETDDQRFRTATITDKYAAEFMVKQLENVQDGSPVLHLMEECLMESYVMYEVHRFCPYLRRFDHLLLRMFEAGLFNQWTKDTVFEKLAKGELSQPDSRRRLEKINMDDLQGAFYLWAVGLLTSSLCFFVELFKASSEYKKKYSATNQ